MSNTFHHVDQKRNAAFHDSAPKAWRTCQDKRRRQHVKQVLNRVLREGESDEQPLFNDKRYLRDWFF